MHDIRHNKNAKKDIYEIKTELEKKKRKKFKRNEMQGCSSSMGV
jgi:hypothetical protein